MGLRGSWESKRTGRGLVKCMDVKYTILGMQLYMKQLYMEI